MGAWGIGHFENDESLDFIGQLLESDTPIKDVYDLFNNINSNKEIEEDCAMAYLAVIDLLINENTDFVNLNDEESINGIKEIYGENSIEIIKQLKKEIVLDREAIKLKLNDIIDEEYSELAELWEDEEEWSDLVKSLIKLI